MENATKYVPGLAVLVAIGLFSRLVAGFVSHIDYLFFSILVGMLVTNTVGIPEWADSGVATYKIWLATGIILMGIQLSLTRILDAGLQIISLVLVIVALSVLVTEALARVIDVSDKLGSLLAAGSSICGASAVIAVGGGIRAKENQMAYAIATILLFDLVTLLTYPVIGTILDLPAKVFGIWAGASMFSTGPVVATSFVYSEVAGRWATLTKLTRNSLIGIAVIAYSLYYSEGIPGTQGGLTNYSKYLWDQFPKFVLGFVFFMLLASFGFVTPGQRESLVNASNWAFMLAFAGLGLNIQLSEILKSGLKPVLVVLVTLLAISGLSLSISLFLFG